MYKDINVNGEIMDLPSVSQIVGIIDKSSALMYWSAKLAAEYIKNNKTHFEDHTHSFDNICQDAITAYKNDTSKEIGTEVHKQIEILIKKGIEYQIEHEFPIVPEVYNCCTAFLDWIILNKVEVIETEKTLVNFQYGFAGTCDAVAIINGTKYIIDWKTSKDIYPEYALQLAAYRMTEGNNLNVAILRLDKETGEYEFKDMTKHIDKKEKAFLCLLDFYYHEKKRKLKNNKWVKEIWK